MKILFIVEHYYPYVGGAEELWKSLSEALVREDHEVKVITTLYNKKLSAREVVNGVDIIRLNVGNRFGFTFFSIPVCIKWARWADIIHTSSYNAALPARFAAWATATKSVITFHEVWGKLWFSLPFLTYVERVSFFLFEKFLLSLRFDRFVGVSKYTYESLISSGVAAQRSTYIYNGLEYSEFKKYKSEKENTEDFTFCYFGRPGVSKGLELLIPAFVALCDKESNLRMKMIISKKPAKVYRWIIRELKNAGKIDRVDFFHNLTREELLSEVSRSSAVVIPSHSEGFCFVAAEAVALEVPILSSGKGALVEVVGGNYLEVLDHTVDSWSLGMLKSKSGKWKFKQPIKYKLEETLTTYLELYCQTLKDKRDRN